MSEKYKGDGLGARIWESGRVRWGGALLAVIVLGCLVTLPWTVNSASALYYDAQRVYPPLTKPGAVNGGVTGWFGTDLLGRSLLSRCLLGGAISLLVGIAAATISVVLGLAVGLVAGFKGGWVDSLLMRTVDILYGLPYFLLIILFKIAGERPLTLLLGSAQAASLVVMFAAIGLVSWLTMARVVRGQVLALKAQPFIEATRALGIPAWRVFMRHILPNLVGPVIVYATLTVPQAILQESFLSFLGVGINPPLPTWGSLAHDAQTDGALSQLNPRWWLMVFPCGLLATTLLSLNFLGDGLRDIFDPKREAAKL